jgi:hypothetical protein
LLHLGGDLEISGILKQAETLSKEVGTSIQEYREEKA